jgi:hypothetical protein
MYVAEDTVIIRGSIERATTEKIEGWIYSDAGPVRDQLILALSGEDCLGVGRVDVFRPDIADAGLGDGNCGFSFPIKVRPDAVDSVVVKLDGSDVVLLQVGANVGHNGSRSQPLKRSTVLWHLARLKWALKRGRISQADFDFLRTLWPMGAYERGLVRRKSADDSVVIDPWRGVARSLFEAYLALDTEIATQQVRSPAEFTLALSQVLQSPDLVTIVALHSTGQATLRALEGSHVSDGAHGEESNLAVQPTEFAICRESLIMLDCRVKADLILLDESPIDLAVAKIPQPA